MRATPPLDAEERAGRRLADALLALLQRWRARVATDMLAADPSVLATDLDAAVQTAIPELLLLFVCEARGIALRSPPRPAVSEALLRELGADVDRPLLARLEPQLLGEVYERSLGSTIAIRDGRAQVEERPGMKKAGGAYYTPAALVDAMVEQTLGALLQGNSPPEIGELRLVDAACGAGAFLVGATRWLLAWYRERSPAGRLDFAERARIVEAHVHGVDIDPGAVAVTRLALLLTILADERAPGPLPDLAANIQRGNAIVDGDPRAGGFVWQRAFPAAFARGGFDVVLGNPPYVDAEAMTQHLADWRAHCARRYRAATGNWDLFCVFVEKTLELARPGGLVSQIVPNKLASADYAAGARAVLADQGTLLAVRDYSSVASHRVFPVAVCPIVYVVMRGRAARRPAVEVERMTEDASGALVCGRSRRLEFAGHFDEPGRPWRMFARGEGPGPFERLRADCPPLAAVATVLGAATVQEAYAILPLLSEQCGEAGELRFVNSGLVDRYATRWSARPCRYIKAVFARPVIAADAAGRLPAKRLQQARAPKLVVAGMTRVLECFLDAAGAWLAGKSTTIVCDSRLDLRYLAGLLNSKLATGYFLAEYGGNRLQRGFLRVGPPQLRTIPIRVPAPGEEARRDALIERVAARIAAEVQLQAGADPPARRALAAAAAGLDAEIDALVYDLYGLADAEVEAIEAAYRAALGACDE